MGSYTRYEVHINGYGRPIIKAGPMAGCGGFEQGEWKKITSRPIGIKRAKAIADEQSCRAVVTEWESSGVVYDNGKDPYVPEGWINATWNRPEAN